MRGCLDGISELVGLKTWQGFHNYFHTFQLISSYLVRRHFKLYNKFCIKICRYIIIGKKKKIWSEIIAIFTVDSQRLFIGNPHVNAYKQWFLLWVGNLGEIGPMSLSPLRPYKARLWMFFCGQPTTRPVYIKYYVLLENENSPLLEMKIIYNMQLLFQQKKKKKEIKWQLYITFIYFSLS